MKLDARLKAIVEEIDGENLLDIGCDHGKVLVSALETGRVRRATGVDISEGSLKKAEKLAAERKVSAEFVLSDGRDVDLNGYDVLVVAGMGGSEIVGILNNRVSYPKRMVLVPHQDKNLLRIFLNAKGLFPKKDYTVKSSGHFYDVIVVDSEGGGVPYRNGEFYAGKNLPKTDAFFEKAVCREKTLRERIAIHGSVSDALREEWEEYLLCLK